MPEPLTIRSEPIDLTTRAVTLDTRTAPQTFDEDTRSVEIVAATQTVAQVYDWRTDRVLDEVLLMSGLDPVPGQVPFLNSHNRWDTVDMLGSVREFQRDGEELIGRVHFGDTARANDVMSLARDGHLTDVSAGYRVEAYQWIEDGKTAEIEGKTYTGPIRIVTKWSLKEVSAVPFGADEAAKVRAAHNRQQTKEKPMDERLRKYLESRGLAKEASDDEAWRFLAELNDKDAQRGDQAGGGQGGTGQDGQRDAPPEGGDGQRSAPSAGGDGQRQAPPAGGGQHPTEAEVAAQQERAAEIFSLCRAHGVDDEQVLTMLRSGQSVDQCARSVLEMVAQRQGGGPGYRAPARVTSDERDTYRAAAIDGLLTRGGVAVTEPAAGFDELRGYSLREMARDCLRRAGRPVGGVDHEMIGRAFTTSDLPNILANVANKSVLFGWEGAAATWPAWADDSGSVPDFKESTLVRLSEFDDLEEMKEDDEYTYAKLADAKESFKIASYGKAIRFGRKMIINDDLSMLTSIPQAMGESAARTVADVVYAAFLSNPNMGDGKPLFHDDHHNVLDIAALDVDGVGAAVQKLTSQKDMEGKRRLNILPQIFLAPTGQFVTAEKFFGSEFIGTAAEPNIKNPFGGTFTKERRVYEPRLDDDAASVIYIMGPKGKTVRIYFLNGVKVPFIDFTDDWNTDGRKGKVRIDVGAKALDWRGMVKATITGGE